MAGGSILGNRVERKEDPKFLTSGGEYADDLKDPRLDGAAQVVYVRSAVAHGTIESMLLHAVIHYLAESELAAGDGAASRRIDERVQQGASRHEAIHELGEDLIRGMLNEPSPQTHRKKRPRGSKKLPF